MEEDRKRTHESKKHLWLITYTSDSVNITAEMLHAGGVVCDECHTIAWRESKYALVHLTKANRVRGSKLEKVLDALRSAHGIKMSLIVGYSTLHSNTKADATSLEDHPGFKHMVHALNHAPDQLESWMQVGQVRTNRKGVLWRFIESVDPRKKTHGQLVAQILEWAPLVRQHADQQKEIEALQAALGVRERELDCVDEKYRRLQKKYRRLQGRVAVEGVSVGK